MLKVSQIWPVDIHSSSLLTCLHHSLARPYFLVQDIPCLPCIFCDPALESAIFKRFLVLFSKEW